MTNTQLKHIGYISTSKKEMSDEELVSLLEQARQTNNNHDITGMLIYSEKSFFQVIEGPSDNIKKIYSIIQKDDRHKNLLILFDEPIYERSFPEWTMGFKRLSDEANKKIPGMNYFLDGKEPLSHYMNKNSESAEMLKAIFAYFLRED